MGRQTVVLLFRSTCIALCDSRLGPDIHSPSHILGHVSINDDFLIQLPQFPFPIRLPPDHDHKDIGSFVYTMWLAFCPKSFGHSSMDIQNILISEECHKTSMFLEVRELRSEQSISSVDAWAKDVDLLCR